MAKNPILEPSVLAKRLKMAREAMGIPQDKLGVMIGLDEGCSSARISRYESGIHQPPLKTIKLMAKALNVPVAYLFCEDEVLAMLILGLTRCPKKKLTEVIKLFDLEQ